jgi:hypothetical protein
MPPPATPLARNAVRAIQTGGIAALQRLLADHPDLAIARVGDESPGGLTRTLLHVATNRTARLCRGTQRKNDNVARIIDSAARLQPQFRLRVGEIRGDDDVNARTVEVLAWRTSRHGLAGHR